MTTPTAAEMPYAYRGRRRMIPPRLALTMAAAVFVGSCDRPPFKPVRQMIADCELAADRAFGVSGDGTQIDHYIDLCMTSKGYEFRYSVAHGPCWGLNDGVRTPECYENSPASSLVGEPPAPPP
jgi:hypothetical protein